MVTMVQSPTPGSYCWEDEGGHGGANAYLSIHIWASTNFRYKLKGQIVILCSITHTSLNVSCPVCYYHNLLLLWIDHLSLDSINFME